MGAEGRASFGGSTSPRRGEKVSYYSAVCLETGEVEVMELEGNSNSAHLKPPFCENCGCDTPNRWP